jgi:hypothetical protein
MTEVFYMHRMAGIQLYGVGGIGAAAQALYWRREVCKK